MRRALRFPPSNADCPVLAKTNLTELSNFRGKGLPHGWSAVGGQTSSAYVQGGYANGGDPIGSSSGSAVGISAGFGAIGLGTETFGSIVSPPPKIELTTGQRRQPSCALLRQAHYWPDPK